MPTTGTVSGENPDRFGQKPCPEGGRHRERLPRETTPAQTAAPSQRDLLGEEDAPSPKPPKAKPNGGAVWKAWVDSHRARQLHDPAPTGPDLKAGKELARLVPPERVAEVLTAFLDDADNFLVKQGHALRLLPGRVNAYLNPTWTPDGGLSESAAQKLFAEGAQG